MEKKSKLPPTYFLLFLVFVVVVKVILPLGNVIVFPFNMIGVPIMGAGLWITIRADQLFKKYNTTVKPFERSVKLVEEGPFRISRNPMYLGFAAILIGCALLLGNFLSVVISFSFVIVMDRMFIGKEEYMLQEAFGQEFVDYKNRVRRWI